MEAVKTKTPPDSVGVRDLKASLSGFLRRVRAGETLIVTDHGEPIARITPMGLPPGLERLVREGRMTWSGRKPEIVEPPLRLRGPGLSASEMVIQMRQERDDIIYQAAVPQAAVPKHRTRRRP